MILTGIAALSLAIWLYLLLGRGGFWHAQVEPPLPPLGAWPEVAAIIPARDEAPVIATAILSLLRQNYAGGLSIVLVDDASGDGTAEIACQAARAAGAEDRLTIIAARPLPSGWTGKLWAMAEGLRALEARAAPPSLVLLTDADIEHDPDNLAALVARLERQGLDLASLMVRLRCESFAERALIPAFVFFFAMLYPFAWVNDPRRGLAGAAGGCILVRRAALERIGGIASIRNALIDDCTLAARVKAGGPTWLGLAERTRSLRPYPRLGDIGRMIARTAYTQLAYSPLLLAATILGMLVTYAAPPALVFAGGITAILAGLAWAAMMLCFLPILRYYGRAPFWSPFLPLIALFYLGATLDSARRHWQGRGGEWKGRVQLRDPA